MNILIVGHVCIDKNVTEHASFSGAGSPAMFMQTIFRQIPDCDIGIAASWGSDFSEYLETIKHFPEHPNIANTMVYENTVTGGVRTQRCHYASESVPPAIDTTLREAVSSADIICLAPLAPNYLPAYVRELLSGKKQECIIVLLPQGYFRTIDGEDRVHVREFTEAQEIVPLIDVLIVSDQDHDKIDMLAAEWATVCSGCVVVTRAEHGADVYTKDNRLTVPADPVPAEKIVSSVGAGDIFAAGFMYTYKKTRDPVAATQSGNALARQCLFVTPDAIQIDASLLTQ